MKTRIDILLVERDLAPTRHKAQALILAGQVLADEQKVLKPGQFVRHDAVLRVLGVQRHVSRGGAKLEAALDHFRLDVHDRVCADLGASTGGFTDCLLQRGAREVHAFDVGRGQLDWRLRSDPRVMVRDQFNVRFITAADFPVELSFVSADLSFISLTKVLPPLHDAVRGLKAGTHAWTADDPVHFIVLVKPQFEAGKGEVGKGGVIRDEAKRQAALESVESSAIRSGYEIVGSIPSPVTGAEGNREFLLYLLLSPEL